jgi:hypothetical protein
VKSSLNLQNCSNFFSRYILSPTHLHEFKSADRISTQTPIMSLYLPEQKLGSHSEPGSSSHKFMLKGSQTGGMHRGHAWVFRAESHDTMMAWFNDIKELTEKKGEERNDFVRRTHARSLSGNQKPPSIGSGNSIMQEDEADAVPYSSEQSVRGQSVPREGAEGAILLAPGAAAALDDNRSEAGWRPPTQRPSSGGRFPSAVDMNRGQQVAPLSPSSAESDREVLAEAGAMPGSGVPFDNTGAVHPHSQLQGDGVEGETAIPPASATYTPGQHPHLFQQGHSHGHEADSQYGEWMAPIAGAGAVAVGGAALGATALHHHYTTNNDADTEANVYPATAGADVYPITAADSSTAIPAHGTSSAPIGIVGAEDHDRSLSRPRGLTESTQATATTHGASQYGAGMSSVSGATLSTVPTSVAMTEETEKPQFGADAGGVGAIEVPEKDTGTQMEATAGTGAKELGPLDIAMPPPDVPTHSAPEATMNGTGMEKAEPIVHVVRPALTTGGRAKSVHTISDLHVPGEFPVRTREGSEV